MWIGEWEVSSFQTLRQERPRLSSLFRVSIVFNPCVSKDCETGSMIPIPPHTSCLVSLTIRNSASVLLTTEIHRVTCQGTDELAP